MQKQEPEKYDRARALLEQADAVLIGGGAGLSAAAGLTYAGKRFSDKFPDFIRKYGMRDMYSAGFYPFASPEEKWAYWSRHILVNRYEPPALALYRRLLALVKDKNYFVITTNVDAQFEKAGFAPERLFAVQGDYGYFQCARGCHDTLYGNEALVRRMAAEQADCRIPAALVPKCPVCGGAMEVHVRKDAYFVQDAAWYGAHDRYAAFADAACSKRLVLLELGVGYNTPTIIRFPFEKLTFRNAKTSLIRINKSDATALPENASSTLLFDEDMGAVLSALAGERQNA